MDRKVVLFLGVPFVTDDQRMINWMESSPLPRDHEKFDAAFPGFIAISRRAVKEVTGTQTKSIGRLQYIKGIIQAFPHKDHPEDKSSNPFYYYLLEPEKTT